MATDGDFALRKPFGFQRVEDYPPAPEVYPPCTEVTPRMVIPGVRVILKLEVTPRLGKRRARYPPTVGQEGRDLPAEVAFGVNSLPDKGTAAVFAKSAHAKKVAAAVVDVVAVVVVFVVVAGVFVAFAVVVVNVVTVALAVAAAIAVAAAGAVAAAVGLGFVFFVVG